MNDYSGPRCYQHDNPEAMHGSPAAPGYPAHTWSGSSPGKCLRCPTPIVTGDLYLCDDGGIIHATCPAGEHETWGWDGATGYRCRCGQLLTEQSWRNAEPLWREHVANVTAPTDTTGDE